MSELTLIAPELRLVLAPNPSPMTYTGTNTYLLGKEELVLIDPGPDNDKHLQSLTDHVGPGQRVTHILVTHSHVDHSTLAKKASAAFDAPVYAFGTSDAGRSSIMRNLGEIGGGEGVDPDFMPDVYLTDGQIIHTSAGDITAHWTPGHFGNHMCFGWRDCLFSGDLVMGWASSLVSPPDGDLTEFMASLDKLLALPFDHYFPGHGDPIKPAKERVDWLIRHRLSREAQIIGELSKSPARPADITAALYADVPPALHPAAERNVLAHLIDMMQKNTVRARPELRADAQFELIAK